MAKNLSVLEIIYKNILCVNAGQNFN